MGHTETQQGDSGAGRWHLALDRRAANLERDAQFPGQCAHWAWGQPAKLCHPRDSTKNASGCSEHPSLQKRAKSVLRNPVVRRRVGLGQSGEMGAGAGGAGAGAEAPPRAEEAPQQCR